MEQKHHNSKVWQYFIAEESGQSMVEYAFILALVALALVVILVAFKDNLLELYSRVENAISKANDAKG